MLPLYDDLPAKRFPFFTVVLILANVSIFALWQLPIGLERSVKLAALVPAQLTHGDSLEAASRIFTSMFLHGGWLHLLGNMWFLAIFGNNVEDACGSLRFLIFYLLCGVAAAVAQVLAGPGSHLPMVGASGAISGVLGAYLLLHPLARVATFIPPFIFWTFRVPAFVFLLFWIAMQILAQSVAAADPASAHRGGVATMAHIGGFLAGLLLIFPFTSARRRYRAR